MLSLHSKVYELPAPIWINKGLISIMCIKIYTFFVTCFLNHPSYKVCYHLKVWFSITYLDHATPSSHAFISRCHFTNSILKLNRCLYCPLWCTLPSRVTLNIWNIDYSLRTNTLRKQAAGGGEDNAFGKIQRWRPNRRRKEVSEREGEDSDRSETWRSGNSPF